ncbi:DUF6036 family nucleotidyltransferase [Micromonospora sp. WMMD975]|uniref:DUF6036 family nucleotidyltransferase n=1 Tax=Micromonospora sp. WMMD975 TaxID=3016087 RepID=UPI00249BF3D5|nr:DUF6036 family nucleotidyltransferase [Micromonospora sp. WMMD975]WFE31561.1 DUF6036 family nucleotidyltransferase [Micromonospora sp. WMMD975]
MNSDDPLLDRAAIEDAFRRLGDRLAKRGVVADLYVFGGAAMALAYDARRATRDIDAVFQRPRPRGRVTAYAHGGG